MCGNKARHDTPARAGNGAFVDHNFLNKNGAPNALVNWSLPGNDIILLKADAGITQSLGEISVKGWPSEDPAGAREQFGAEFLLPGKKKTKLPFQESKIGDGEERVTNLLKSIGYWNAKVTTTKNPQAGDGSIPITLNIVPGPLFKLSKPQITSPIPPPVSLVEMLDDIIDAPASSDNVRGICSSITK